jgi:hypothetical protein
MGLDEIIAIATKHRAAIIIKTTWQSIRKPGGWYIKGMTHMTHMTNENEWLQTNGTIITYDDSNAYAIEMKKIANGVAETAIC